MIILEIIQTLLLVAGVLAIAWLAIQASIIADYIRAYLDSQGIHLEDGAPELRTTETRSTKSHKKR